jgi:hypothetical protein
MPRPYRRDLPGRPSKYRLEAAVEVLQRMADGEPLYRICQDEHLPPASTVRSWAENPKHEWFGRAFRKAQQEQAHTWFEQTIEIADDVAGATTAPEVFAAQTRIRARQFAASRLAPEAYAERSPPAAGAYAEVTIVLPSKQNQPGDDARLVNPPGRIEDGSDG